MVISSDFETRSYRSLWFRFGRQFLFFVICLLASAGILYGIERNSAKLSEGFNMDDWKETNVANVEQFVNGTGFKAIQKFSQTHRVDTQAIKDFVHHLAVLTYTPHNESISSYYDNLNHLGMTYLEALVCILSVLTTVGWGHVTPVTVGSKVFTAFVAIFGIPLFYMMIISGSQIVIRLSKDVLRKCCREYRIDTFYKPLIGFVLFVYILLASEIIAKMEGFEYHAALWYSVMSLTTVGFGDVVQTGDKIRLIYGKEASQLPVAIFLLFWLVCGFILIGALALSVIYDNWGGDKKTAHFQHIFKRGEDELVENMEEEENGRN